MRPTSGVIFVAVLLLAGRAHGDAPPSVPSSSPALSAMPLDVLYENHLGAESQDWLSINLFWNGLDAQIGVEAAQAKNAANFLIFSPDDPRFGLPGLPAALAGSRTRTIKIPQRNTDLVKATAIFLSAEESEPLRFCGFVGRNQPCRQ